MNIKPNQNKLLHPIDWFNHYGDFVSIFNGSKNFKIISSTEVHIKLENAGSYGDCFVDNLNGTIKVMRETKYKWLIPEHTTTKFMVLAAIQFENNMEHALSYVEYHLLKKPLTYVRVGDTYMSLYKTKNRYGADTQMIKPFAKAEIVQDNSKDILPLVPKFYDFTIEPNNLNYSQVVDSCFNQYSAFPHKPSDLDDISWEQFPATVFMLNHIFGSEAIELGLRYMQCLYLHPKQSLPILSLVSTERGTGKTTFLNWISMLFGNNSVLISPSDLASQFNSIYATKNIILIDETTIDKQNTIERLKSLVTAKEITVNQKFMSNYALPFFGKVILCTNKEDDFLKVDEEEIRFWIRKVPVIKNLNTNVEHELFKEIPFFLKFLIEMPAIDFSKSRMVFTPEEIQTKQLAVLKEESKSGLRKEIEYLLSDFFVNNPSKDIIEATPKDIKTEWFANNNLITNHYISKILRTEMKVEGPIMKRYVPFNQEDAMLEKPVGHVFIFRKVNYL